MTENDPSKANLSWCYEQIEFALRVCASPADAQIGYHADRHGIAIDEIALEFEDAVRAVPALTVAGMISPEDRERIEHLDAYLAVMSDDESLWTEEALRGREEWARVRELASGALEHMGV
ncbi:MAG: hypothetical protein RLN60_05265 [Phycisphaerales bacterium]